MEDMQANIKTYAPKDILASLLHIFTLNTAEPKEIDGETDASIVKFNKEQTTQQFEIPVNVTANRLSPSFVAGICILDLVQSRLWNQTVFISDNQLVYVSD